MAELQKPESPKPWYYPLRALAIFIIFFVLKSLTEYRILLVWGGYQDAPIQLFFALSALGALLIFNSVLNLFTLYDRPALEIFKKEDKRSFSLFSELFNILRSKEFIIETSIFLTLICLSSGMGGFAIVARIFYPFEAVVSPFAVRLVPIFVLLPLSLIVSLLCRYEARRYWRQLINRREERRLRNIPTLILKAALVCILYPLVFPYSPAVVFLFITFAGVVGIFIKEFSLLGFIIAVTLLILLIFGISRLRYRKRIKKFKKELTAIASDNGYELELFEKEKASKLGYDFVLRRGSDLYSCKLVRARRRGVPLYFTSENSAFFLHRIGTKNHHWSIERHFDYGFEAEGIKCLVIIKYPKKIFASSHGAARRLVGGDRIWKYIVYDAPSFLGATDRKCLAKYNDDMRN